MDAQKDSDRAIAYADAVGQLDVMIAEMRRSPPERKPGDEVEFNRYRAYAAMLQEYRRETFTKLELTLAAQDAARREASLSATLGDSIVKVSRDDGERHRFYASEMGQKVGDGLIATQAHIRDGGGLATHKDLASGADPLVGIALSFALIQQRVAAAADMGSAASAVGAMPEATQARRALDAREPSARDEAQGPATKPEREKNSAPRERP